MSIGQAIDTAIKDIGMTQVEFGKRVFISGKLISAFKKNRRDIKVELLKLILAELDHPVSTLTSVHDITGGVFGSPILDGDAIDLHRTSVWAKVFEELREAALAMEDTEHAVVNSPLYISPELHQQIREAMIQLIDVRVGIDNLLAVICQEYAIRPRELFAEHARKLEAKGYIKKDRYESGAVEME